MTTTTVQHTTEFETSTIIHVLYRLKTDVTKDFKTIQVGMRFN